MSDLMLLGVLRMPWDDKGDMTLIQIKSRMHQAADQIEELELKLAAATDALRFIKASVDSALEFSKEGENT